MKNEELNRKSNKDGLIVWLLIISIIVLFIFLMFLSNEFSYEAREFKNEWGSFLGSITGSVIGAMATILVFKITTNESKRQFDIIEDRNRRLEKRQNDFELYQIEKERIEKLPWLSLDVNEHREKMPPKIESKSIYVSYDCLPIINNRNKLSYEAPTQGWGFSDSVKKPDRVFEYCIKNVGANTALGIRCSINDDYIDEFDLCMKDEIYIFLSINDITSTISED